MKNKKLNIDLKAFAANIVVDAFGYEEMITKNAMRYVEDYSNQLNVAANKVQLLIKPSDRLSYHLIASDHFNKPIGLEELTSFFTGDQVLKTDPICKRVENGINSFIEDYCKKWQFDRNQTSFYISVDNKQLFIKAYLNDKNIDQIAIKSIIKFLF